MDMINEGGYIGNFCIEQNHINDTRIQCGPKLSKCIGKGKMEYYNDSVPLNLNYYYGHCRKCSVSCDFNWEYYQIDGEYKLWTVMLFKKLKLISSTLSISDDGIYSAWVENLNLIDEENIDIKFYNSDFHYSDIKIENNDKLSFRIKVNNNEKPNFISRLDLIYGLKECRRYLSLGYVMVNKPNLKCTCTE